MAARREIGTDPTIKGTLPVAFPYQGSKRRLAPSILQFFPYGARRLIEPFAGSAAVTVAAVASGIVESALIADSNKPLAELWRLIIDDPGRVSSSYEDLWRRQLGNERDFYDEVRETFNKTKDPLLLLFLLARCVKAAVRYNAAGEFNQSPDNRRLGTRPDRMRTQIHRTSRLLAGRAETMSEDYRTVLEQATGDDVIYLDPPYQGVSSNRNRRYSDTLMLDEFVDSLMALNNRNLSFIVSYDGRTGNKTHGQLLPSSLSLARFEIDAGRSAQATFLGRSERTVESIYVSAALMERNGLTNG